ncbi:MAG TPA: Vms1/Ankzf1 family peptidyl-tRNA hydrolase, partial [Candidatus Poseidoniales archaeon]|nr:Vms1/Ankzf1 family peptidyl-tRNA hydrolase [Candidatus Poseidoniales archaeon]
SNLDNRDTFLSVYVDLVDPRHSLHLQRRIRAIKRSVGNRALEVAVDDGLETLLTAFTDLGEGVRSAVGFIDIESGFLRIGGLGSRIPTSVVLDASPYILPLAQFQDSYETFVLVLIDGQHCRIHLVHDAIGEEVSEHSHSAMGAHRRGGWSQARYQRARRGVVNSFFDEVAEDLARLISEIGATRIIVAGAGTAKQNFCERLPNHLAELVIRVEDVDPRSASDDSLLRQFADIGRRAEEEQEKDDVARLRRSLATDELAMIGIYDVLDAAAQGRVEILLVSEGNSQSGRKCEPCDSYMRRQGQTCPSCSSEGNEVDLVNEAVEAAVRISAEVEFTADPFIEAVGGVAALLRW